jgi:hypothetical protein
MYICIRVHLSFLSCGQPDDHVGSKRVGDLNTKYISCVLSASLIIHEHNQRRTEGGGG